MNKERIEQLALEVANRKITIVNCQLLASEVKEFAISFLAQVDALRAKEGPVAYLWRDMNSGGKGGVLKVCQVTPCGDSFPVFLHPQPAPEGHKLVPIEPTKDMYAAGEDTFVSGYTGTPISTPGQVWEAMLAAAPEVKP